MTEYVPLFKPGQSQTRQASAAITGGQLVGVSGSGTVAPTGANQVSWVGVAAFDAANGDQVTVHSGGVQRILAAGAVTAGDLVVASATAGRVSTLAAVTTPTPADVTNTRAIVGTALTSAADGELVEVQMDR